MAEDIIEVTKQTFDKLFNEQHQIDIVKKETYEKVFYYNEEIDQRGLMVSNYVSSEEGNFYLTDINI